MLIATAAAPNALWRRQASAGLRIRVKGVASHASEPHKGQSPMVLLGRLAEACATLPRELLASGAIAPQIHDQVRCGWLVKKACA
jgi:metal-dependent amidase/aminoacylase/carboxypeptidase family protein